MKETIRFEQCVHGEWEDISSRVVNLEHALLALKYCKDLGLQLRFTYSLELDEDVC